MFNRSWMAVGALACAALLAGCSDDNNDDDTSTPAVTAEVPTSASESASGFIAYLKELVVASADTLEPVDISTVTPPADDTSEPTSVD